MNKLLYILFITNLIVSGHIYAQRNITDTVVHKLRTEINKNLNKVDIVDKKSSEKTEALSSIPNNYIKLVNKKINNYNKKIESKTIKTLTKLSKWETKIQSLLQKANPEIANKLFSPNQQTFATILQKVKANQNLVIQYQDKYNSYNDKLFTSLKYLKSEKGKLKTSIVKPLEEANSKLENLQNQIENSDAITEFIKERKKLLLNESVKYLSKSKYIKKINKEAYYYVENLRNYKEIFSDSKKTEEFAMKLLENIPEFKEFFNKNSQISSTGLSTPFSVLPNIAGTMPIVNGLASRVSLNQYMSNEVPSLNIAKQISEIQNQLSVNTSPLSELKRKLNSAESMPVDIPNFKPNTQKTKSFKKRLEYGTDLQFGKSVNYIPATASIALKLGYKLNDKSSIGVGINYLAGLGNGWNNIKLSNEGVGLRTYIKWKLKNIIDLQGGGEWNYMNNFKNIDALKNTNAWQKAALLGINKHYSVNKKLNGNVQLLYDFLANTHYPRTAPILFRFGYNLK